MNVLQFTTTFVVRELVQGAAQALAGDAGGAIVQNVVGFLSKRFTDHSKRIVDALQTANDRAWRALEIAVVEGLTPTDLEAGWEYVAAHPEEIEQAVRDNEAGDEGLVE